MIYSIADKINLSIFNPTRFPKEIDSSMTEQHNSVIDVSLLETASSNSFKYLSFFPAFVNIVSTLTGPEVLSVANSMTLMGLIYSVAMMTGTTILSYLGTIIVLKLRQIVDAESINDLATKIVGKWCGTFYSALTLTFTYSCQVAYLIIGAESVTTWAGMLGYPQLSRGFPRAILVLVYSLVLPVALSIPRELKILSYISTCAIFCQVLYIASMIYEAAVYLPKKGIDPSTELYRGGFQFFQAFAIYSQLYAFPSVVLPLVREYNPELRSRYRLIGASFVSCFTISLVPGVLGYIIFGAGSAQIAISSFPDSDIFMQVVRVGFFIVVNASFSIVSITVMQDISSVCFKNHDPSSLPILQRIAALALANAPPVIVAMALPNVRPAFEVGGAFGGCLSNFFVPPLLYVIRSERKWFHPLNLLMILFSIFGLVSAGIATYQAVVDAINGDD